MSAWRDKDNRERRLDGAEKENIKGATPKKKSLELDNEVISKAILVNEEIGKKGVDMDSLNNEPETKTSPPVKKKVKAKIKAKQKSKQDINDQQSQNDNNKVNINTANNSTIPNELSPSSSSKNINTNNNTTNTNTTNNTNTNTPNTPNTRNTTKTTTTTNNNTQQDKMQKLSFLTDLYEQGYITVVEYKERKSQLIDELTGTRTRTRTNSHLRLQPPTVVASPPPDWSTRKEETAIKHVYDTQKNQWSTTVVKVKVDTEPFACGGLRKCYHLHDGTRPEDNYVAKLSIDPFEDHEIYFIDVEIQMHSKEFARKFNQYNPPKNVDFVMAWLLELVEREGRPLCGVETFIEGPYRKHNNNFGYVSEDERNTPQAFSHFTYEASNHKILICDIQGVADLYTDPQMHTMDNKKAQLMGKGNMGVRGISKFLATHQCNAICRYLRLPSINAKINDAGTVPAQTYMSYQKVDIVNIECYHPSPHLFDKSASSPLLDSHSSNSSSGSTTAPPPKSRTCSCTIL